MGTVIGIDLGTTNSCVAIPESADIPRKAELIDSGRLIPVGGALVIADENGASIVPSAVWVDRDGAVTVGAVAKAAARSPGEPPPALFFKRLMGTDERVLAGHRHLLPEEASAHLLAHLKRLAEEVLGEPVTRAVVTVPAFFELNAKKATARAGELAGIEVAETLLEPVAAALMYTRTTDLADPVTFMVYDLGGGTFDVSIVTWDPDVGFDNRSFDGDRYLGGFDFDYAIVRWMVSKLDRYDLDLDEEDPSDQALLASLLLEAEAEKHVLSKVVATKITETQLADRRRTPMIIGLPFTRADFESLIEARIDATLVCCEQAIDKAAKLGVRTSELAEVVMVGGSSRIPLVARKLRQRFGREPLVVDPDLCVAVGAALKAAMVATTSSYLVLDRPPARTSRAAVDLSGTVRPGPGLRSVADVSVELASDDGMTRLQEITDSHGGFLFADVALNEHEENGFTVRVMAEGAVLDSQRALVEHAAEVGGRDQVPQGDLLAHDLRVKVERGPNEIGFDVLAPAGTPLPYQVNRDFETTERAQQTGEVVIELYDDNQPIGEIQVPGLRRGLAVGTLVHVELDIFPTTWVVRGRARVPAAGEKAVAMVDIPIPMQSVATWDALRARFIEVKAIWQDKLAGAPPDVLLSAGPAVERLLDRAEELLNQGHDRAQLQHTLDEVESMVKSVIVTRASGLEPPREAFIDALDELDRLVGRLEATDHDAAADQRASASSLRSAGLAAHDAGNALDWQRANENVAARIEWVKRKLGIDGPDGPPPAPMVLFLLAQEVEEILQKAGELDRATRGAHAARLADVKDRARAVLAQAHGIDLSDDRSASIRLIQLYHTGLVPLRERLNELIGVAGASASIRPVKSRV